MSSIRFEPAERLKQLPPYLFAEVDRRKREQIARGKDIIDLGVGDPDIPTPQFIIDALSEAANDPKNHRYALDAGMPSFRESIAAWFKRRFSVTLDPMKEILPLIGSKEGIAHMPLALVNPGDFTIVPDPCYPPYRSGTLFAGGTPCLVPLFESNGFLMDFSAIDPAVLKKAKILYLNYPNNPTAAIAPKAFFEEAVEFARQHQLLIVQDAAYSEMGFDSYLAPSILEVEGAREVVVEFHSLSKTFNMTGWRVGFAVGNPEVIALLGKVKANVDSGIFQAIQVAAKKALDEGDKIQKEIIGVYQKRRDILAQGFKDMGWPFNPQQATFYSWIAVPPGSTSTEFAVRMLEDMNIVVTPGNGFGPSGEGYFRISLTVPEARIKEAIKRIQDSHKSSAKR